jgi:hypothetical protein
MSIEPQKHRVASTTAWDSKHCNGRKKRGTEGGFAVSRKDNLAAGVIQECFMADADDEGQGNGSTCPLSKLCLSFTIAASVRIPEGFALNI